MSGLPAALGRDAVATGPHQGKAVVAAQLHHAPAATLFHGPDCGVLQTCGLGQGVRDNHDQLLRDGASETPSPTVSTSDLRSVQAWLLAEQGIAEDSVACRGDGVVQ